MSLSTGERIGPYEILSAIGAGGMGEVYEAKDSKLKRRVALKVLPAAFAKDRERLARITREAEVLASLNHPNIATIYGVEDGAIVMELVDGAPPKGPLPFEDAWAIASQIAQALEYAHDRGIVHRDLKPANVKVTQDGVVKLLDFGLAKAFTNESTPSANLEHSPTLTINATELGLILGTAAYMSPEQAKGKTVDKRADIWAFGVVFYELLTGRRLFRGEDVSETLAQVLTKEPDLTTVHPRAQRLLRRCLEKDPRKRLRDIGEARYYIDEAAPVVNASRRNVIPWAVAAAAVAVAAGLYAYRPRHEDPLIRSFILPPPGSSFRCEGDDGGPAALAPDGKRIAFAAPTADDKVMLWVRQLDSMDAKPLEGTEGAMFPFWAPDSSYIGFFADTKLKVVHAGGGIVNVLAEAPASRGGTWSRDNVIVFSPRLTSPLLRISASGGSIAPVTHLDAKQQEISHRWPSFLPDGKHLLYTSRGRGVFVASIDGSDPPRRLLEESSNAQYSGGAILYGRANTVFARPFDTANLQFTGGAVPVAQGAQAEINSDRTCFSASSSGLLAYHFGAGQSQLAWYDRRGNRLGTVGDAGLIRGVEIAPHGRSAAVVLGDAAGSATIWIYDLHSTKRHRFSSESAFNLGVAWSRDATRLAVAAKREATSLVYARDVADPRTEEVFFQSPFEILIGSWLADGTITLSTRNPKTGWDVSYLPADHHRGTVSLLSGQTDEVIATSSADGRWMLYTSGEPGDMVLDLYAVGFPKTGRRYQVSTNGAHFGRWVPNGNEIVYARGKALFSVSVRAVGETLDIGAPKPLFTLQAECVRSEISCFDVSPDGNRFLVLDPTGAPPPVAVVQNWTADLKK